MCSNTQNLVERFENLIPLVWYSIATIGPVYIQHFIFNSKSCKIGTKCYETSKESWEWMYYSIFSFTHQRKPPPMIVCTPNWRGIKIRILCTTPHLSTHTWIWDLYLYTMMLVLFDMVIKNTQVYYVPTSKHRHHFNSLRYCVPPCYHICHFISLSTS